MSEPDEPGFQRATPVLKSTDYNRSRAFYVETLGFQIVEEGGDPPQFGIFERGGAVLFVDAWQRASNPVAGAWEAYIHVTGLNDLFQIYKAAGAAILREPTDTVYGMREFDVADPDGNVICFGEDQD